MALGSLLIKERYQFSDEETVAHITMNPYLQYFIGLEAFTQKSPFDQSMMTRFRKRISTKTLQEVNDIIIGRETKKKDDDGDSHSGGSGGNRGTLILDATCAPQSIRFPTDGSRRHRDVAFVCTKLQKNPSTFEAAQERGSIIKK